MTLPNIQPAHLKWDQIIPGMSIKEELQFTKRDLKEFAKLSGDYNPLHMDPTFAKSKGFKSQVVYAGLLISAISRVIGMRLPGRNAIWLSLNVDFHNPLYIDTPASLNAEVENLSDAVNLIELRITIATETQNIAKGSAEVLLRDTDE